MGDTVRVIEPYNDKKARNHVGKITMVGNQLVQIDGHIVARKADIAHETPTIYEDPEVTDVLHAAS